MAGARAVQIGSAVGENINIFNDISSCMKTFLTEKEWTLDDIYGMAHKA